MNPFLILVVDPDVDRLTRIRDAVSDRFDVVLESNSSDALAHARSRGPAAIVVDFPVPMGAGRSLTEALREDPATRGIPVVAFSGWEYARTRSRAETLGCAAFVGHSEGIEALLSVLDRLAGTAAAV
jgi:CheY-like chemotaxis protein